MITKESTVTAVKDQVSTNLGGEVAVLHLVSGVYYSLNEVGARIWELIQESQPVGQILATLLEEYDVAADVCERHLLAILEELRKEKLIRVENGSPS
jgi:hypothetical protein